MGSDTGRFSWEASWHSLSNFEVFLIRDCQSCFLVQSHIVDRHHIPQNLIWSQGLVFLVNSSKTESLISRKEECILHQEKAVLSTRVPSTKNCNQPINQQKNPTPKEQQQQKNKTEKPKPIHKHTHQTLVSGTISLCPLTIISYRAILWWLQQNISCLWRQILHEGI